jgi:xylan 1,4-beta-xylosidase
VDPRHHLHDELFAAAFATRILMDVNGLVEGDSYWTFSDIFEENYFPSITFHCGFRLLNQHGIAKPIYRAFQMLHSLDNQLFQVKGKHDTVAVWGARKEYTFTFRMVNQAMPEYPIHTEQVELTLTNTPEPLAVYVESVDEDHAKAKKIWVEMGEPEYPSAYEVDALKAASGLVQEPLRWTYDQGVVHFQLSLPHKALQQSPLS